MKYIKLFFISVIVFGVMLFCISLLFPSTTIVSRAVNVKGSRDTIFAYIPDLHLIAFKQAHLPTNKNVKMLEARIWRRQNADTIISETSFASHIQQGVAIYDLHSDSTAIQVFYKIHVPTYKFWDKFGLMLNEAKYGPSLDSAISRIKKQENLFKTVKLLDNPL